MIVILRNLPSDTQRDDLEHAFGRFGRLLEIAISHDANLSWIRFENAHDARNAVQTLLRNPTPIFGHWTMMYFARPVEEEIRRKTTEDLTTYEAGTDTDDNDFVSLSASGARGIENEESSYDSESYDSESESSYDSESSYESSYDSEYSESESELDPNVEPGNE